LAQVIQTERWEVNVDLRASVALDRWQIEHADTVTVPSEGVLGGYHELMGVESEAIRRLRRVALGILPDLAPPASRSFERLRLLFVGRCELRKGVHTLLEVLPTLLSELPEWECHLVGDDAVPIAGEGTLKQRFVEQHRDAPWLSRVVFHGVVDEAELRRQYQLCDLFVAPSLYESFGLIYHEAMQYGKAVVGCRTGGVPEVVADGVEGLLVTPDRPSELEAALARLMRDGDLREQMGQAGARRVHEIEDYKTMAAGFEGVYLETIAAVGAERRAQRGRHWGHALSRLDDPGALRAPAETMNGHGTEATSPAAQAGAVAEAALLRSAASPSS
jgi:glycosyltransferase involved in cell wall biosynthesis